MRFSIFWQVKNPRPYLSVCEYFSDTFLVLSPFWPLRWLSVSPLWGTSWGSAAGSSQPLWTARPSTGFTSGLSRHWSLSAFASCRTLRALRWEGKRDPPQYSFHLRVQGILCPEFQGSSSGLYKVVGRTFCGKAIGVGESPPVFMARLCLYFLLFDFSPQSSSRLASSWLLSTQVSIKHPSRTWATSSVTTTQLPNHFWSSSDSTRACCTGKEKSSRPKWSGLKMGFWSSIAPLPR